MGRFLKARLLVSWFVLALASSCAQAPAPTPRPSDPPTAAPPTAAPTPAPTATPSWDDLARTPPMGWNTFNRFGCDVDDALIRETADAMVSSGMQAAGYEYVIIDDCWMAPSRDAGGNLQADPVKFPHGIEDLADYVHAKGLKFGLYLDRGTKTCAGYPGSYGYELQDANTLAAWGVDYLKYDNCNPVGKLPDDYRNMHDALVATGRPILFSMCSWGFPGYWAQGVAHMWRTTGDIKDNWQSMITIMDANHVNAAAAGPGHWNDPDMLEVGNGGMTDVEYQTHFTMWAMMAAPLIAGNDLRTMSAATRNILTAPEVIAVDQDRLGVQGRRVSRMTGLSAPQVWARPLSGANTYAVALLNRSEEPADMTLSWSDVDLPPGPATVRDLWEREDLGVFDESFTAEDVPPHAVVLIKIISAGGVSAAATPNE